MNIFDRIPLQEYEKKRLLRDIKCVEDIEDKIELGPEEEQEEQLKTTNGVFKSNDMSSKRKQKQKQKHKHKDTHQTILLSECPEELGHDKCRISYSNNNGRFMELCMCRCHSHAKPPTREPEPILGIAALKDIH
jgi:hypothetical protein